MNALQVSMQRWLSTAAGKFVALIAVATTLVAMLEAIRDIYNLFAEDLPALIRDALSEALGVAWSEAEDISMAVLTEKVSEASGIQFSDLTDVVQVRADLEAHVIKIIYDRSGIQLGSLDPDALKEQIVNAVIDGLLAEGNKFIPVDAAQRILIAVWEQAKAVEHGRAQALLPMDIDNLVRRHRHRPVQREYESRHDRRWYPK